MMMMMMIQQRSIAQLRLHEEAVLKPGFHIAVTIGRLPAMRRRSIVDMSQVVLFLLGNTHRNVAYDTLVTSQTCLRSIGDASQATFQ